VGIGALPPRLLARLGERLSHRLGMAVDVRPERIDPSSAFDGRRRQYLVTTLVELAGRPSPKPGTKRLGITTVDLFLPVFTHLVGYAPLGGETGVVSSFRLGTGLDDRGLLMDRLEKEVLHEFGHTLGLVHCRLSWCVMRPSVDPDELDLRDAAFCEHCADHVGVDGFAVASLTPWYEDLAGGARDQVKEKK
jgi:archaemetzincin